MIKFYKCLVIFNYLYIYFNFRYSKEEPFSVISVDIRNHSNLTDSLEQYVKGELLEGADAYHCDKCNKKVGINDNENSYAIINKMCYNFT